jgi:hypothetical protein
LLISLQLGGACQDGHLVPLPLCLELGHLLEAFGIFSKGANKRHPALLMKRPQLRRPNQTQQRSEGLCQRFRNI